MTVAFIVLWVVAVASIVAAAYFAVHLVEDGAVNATVFIASYLAEQQQTEDARRKVLYQQEKALQRVVAASDRDVRKLIEHATSLRDESIGLQQRVDAQLRRHEAA
jgi:uncharacterized protein YpuA (DUF1002 family)